MHPEGRRKEPGREGGHDAVGVGEPCAEGDEREHV